MVTSVIELSDKLYKKSKYYQDICYPEGEELATALAKVCSNANDLGLPLLVVQQLLKGTGYEQLLS